LNVISINCLINEIENASSLYIFHFLNLFVSIHLHISVVKAFLVSQITSFIVVGGCTNKIFTKSQKYHNIKQYLFFYVIGTQ